MSKTCTYYLNNKEFSYQQLITYLAVNLINSLKDLSSIADNIVFSYASETATKIDNAAVSKYGESIAELDEFGLSFNDVKTVLQYIDSPLFTPIEKIGDPFPMKVNKDEFINWCIDNFIDKEGLSPSEARAKAEKLVNHWDVIKKDATDLHKFLTYVIGNYKLDNIADFERALHRYPDLERKIIKAGRDPITGETVQTKLYNSICKINRNVYSNMKNLRSTEKGMEKFHLKFDGITLNKASDFEKIGIHIDRMFIDKFGRVHVFNYKITGADSKFWSPNKKRKYQYEMAFLKAILKLNGIDVNGAKFYHIPIVLNYSGDTDILEDVKVNDFINYSTNTIFDLLYAEAEENLMNTMSLDVLEPEHIAKADEFCRLINQDWKPEVTGLQISTSSWIKKYKNRIERDYDTGGWIIHFSKNNNVKVSDPTTPRYNPEIKEKVSSYLKDRNTGENSIASVLVDAIINNYGNSVFFENGRFLGMDLGYLKKTFGKYFTYKEIEDGSGNKEKVYDWEINDDQILIDCGILMFHNKITNQIDVITTTSFDPREFIPVDYKHHTKILGYHISDAKNASLLDNTYGNMEIMRTISLLNLVAPQLDSKYKLGQIQIISPSHRGSAALMDLETAVKEFNKVGNQLHQIIPSYTHKSNFNSNLFMDRLDIIYDLYKDLIDPTNGLVNPAFRNTIIENLHLDDFKNLKDTSAKISKMKEIMYWIAGDFKGNPGIINTRNPKDIYDIAYDRSLPIATRTLAQIYISCAEHINRFNGIEFPEIKYLNQFKRYVLPQYANPDSNVRKVTGMYNRALDLIAQGFLKEYNPIRKIVKEFYELKGFNVMLGNSSELFEKMFEKLDNKKTWYFVNPFNPSDLQARLLDNIESTFLKKIIFHLAKIRARSGLSAFEFKDYNDPKFAEYVNKHRNTLLVPLERKSNLTLQHIGKKLRKAKQEVVSFMKDPKQYAKDKLAEDDRTLDAKELDFYLLNLNNQFIAREELNCREELLYSHDEDYWEVNLEYLVADYTESLIAAEELEKVIFQAKAILMEMELQQSVIGDNAGAGTWLQSSINEILDFLKLNIFGKSLMDPSSQELVTLLSPAKHMLSKMFIAWNLKGAVRDTFEGIWQNFALTVSKYYSDLDAVSVMSGYKTVLQDMFKDDATLNIISELCLKYRLSNTDAAKIAERAKIDKGGVFNFDRLGYSTLRQPDFLNRMTLFVAKCKKEGIFEAFSIDPETESLKYDCTKDRRFEKFIKNDQSDKEEYMKQKALYYYYVNEYNKEHPDNLITMDFKLTPLPEPFTTTEVENMKNVANTKYGAYDKSQKSKLSHTAIGHTLLLFSDWFNGHTAAYMREKGFYEDIFTLKDDKGNFNIKKAASGNELWFNQDGNIYEKTEEGKFIDENGEEITEGEFVPVIEKVPIYALGIFYTLKDTLSVLKKDGLNLTKFKEEIWNNDWDRQNFKKLGTDALFLMLLGLLFGKLLPDAYNAWVKERDKNDFISNALVDTLYLGSTSSFEGFKGPIAIFDYASEDISPSLLTNIQRVTKDGFKTLIGNKTFTDFSTSNLPVVRLGKKALKQEHPDWYKTDSD